jgi:hypothetical protein
MAYLRKVPPTRIGHVAKTLNINIPPNIWTREIIYISDIYDPTDYLIVDFTCK